MGRSLHDKFHRIIILALCVAFVCMHFSETAADNPAARVPSRGKVTSHATNGSSGQGQSESNKPDTEVAPSTQSQSKDDNTLPSEEVPGESLPDTPPLNMPESTDSPGASGGQTITPADNGDHFPLESIAGFSWQLRPEYPAGFIFERYAPAVVGLVLDRQPSMPAHEMKSLLSGITISRDGLVITTNHQVEDYYNEFNQSIGDVKIYAIRRGEKTLREMKLAYRDIAGDIAVFQMQRQADEVFPYVEFSDRVGLKVGETVYSVSYPDALDLEGGLATGIITEIGPREVLEGGLTTQVITSDARIAQSSCGGLILDRFGRVIGMSTGRLTRSLSDRMCHFYRAEDLKEMIAMAASGSEENRPESWLGVSLLNDTGYDSLKSLYDFPDGVYVRSVYYDSPAYIVDIQPGDIIRKINGRNVRSVKDFLIIMSGVAIGEEVQIDLLRPKVNMERDKRTYTVPYPIRN